MIDFSDVLTDPELGAQPVRRLRVSVAIDDHGYGVRTETALDFTGAVTMDKASILELLADGSYVAGSILVHSMTDLRVEGADGDADILVWNGKRYKCAKIGNYTWHGFNWAVAEPDGVGA